MGKVGKSTSLHSRGTPLRAAKASRLRGLRYYLAFAERPSHGPDRPPRCCTGRLTPARLTCWRRRRPGAHFWTVSSPTWRARQDFVLPAKPHRSVGGNRNLGGGGAA